MGGGEAGLRKWQAAGAKPGRGSGWGEVGAKLRDEYTFGGLVRSS